MNVKCKRLILLVVFPIIFSCNSPSSDKIITSLEINKLERVRVLLQAKKYFNEKPITVTASQCERSASGIHDYYSEGDYWWPDSDNPEGAYIRRDGLTNPANFNDHRLALRRLSLIVPAFTGAYKITGERKYALKAIEHLKAWFVNPETRMNPNLLFSQAIKGRSTGRGIGIIDTIHLVEVVKAMIFLDEKGILEKEILEGLRTWFSEYLNWLTTHPFGIAERDNGNNHSTCWAMQVAMFASFTQDSEKMDFCRNFYKDILLPQQVSENGSFPLELNRTKPYAYSLFNLDAMATLCEILSTEKENLWEYKTPDQISLKKAMDFMFPFIQNKSDWPYPPDVMYFDEWPMRQPALFFSALAFNNIDYSDLWKTLKTDSEEDEIIRNLFIRQPVLWID
ncbi:MAG: alginate lyase family protein [Mariniphaga sp.]|nr:alginate lyase family protein [Mariniphaga sp.]